MLPGKTLQIEATGPEEETLAALKALASGPRWRILRYLATGRHSINDVAEALNLPPSTAAAQIKILEEAGLIYSELQSASHGLQKICTRIYDNVLVQLPHVTLPSSNVVDVSMPVGAYSRFDVRPTCGLASPTSIIGYLDDPLSFYEPERMHASLIWFRSGFVEYVFPNRLPEGASLLSVQVSMEVGSEAPFHNLNWPSDVTVWINEQEIGTWTCPADFGGERGVLTPTWWDSKESQYGLLKRWLVNDKGSYIDGHPLSPITIHGLNFDKQRVLAVRIGVKGDALHTGGVNIFGHAFGNYPQDLVLRLEYLPGKVSGNDLDLTSALG